MRWVIDWICHRIGAMLQSFYLYSSCALFNLFVVPLQKQLNKKKRKRDRKKEETKRVFALNRNANQRRMFWLAEFFTLVPSRTQNIFSCIFRNMIVDLKLLFNSNVVQIKSIITRLYFVHSHRFCTLSLYLFFSTSISSSFSLWPEKKTYRLCQN